VPPKDESSPTPFTLLTITDRLEVQRELAERIDPAWAKAVRGSAPGAGSADGTLEAAGADLVLLDVPPSEPKALAKAVALAGRLRDSPAAVVALADRLSPIEKTELYRAGVLACVSLEENPEEFGAHLASLLASKRPVSEALRRLRTYTRHLDEQLRLAQRLQMDFLPHRLPTVAGGRFAARLEPAAWVAGDFYDIFRLDERHIAFYIADAIGHGIPAALLTVFVKKSLQAKRIEGKSYELIGPDEALRLLNLDLLSAKLQETPFITMVYGLYNEATRECVYARAGHPRPLLIGRDGNLEELEGEGPLLGIFSNARFDRCRRRLEPGDRLFLYTDGAERVEPVSVANPERLYEIIRASAMLPVEEMLDSIMTTVREGAQGGRLADDVTLLALELEDDLKQS
jgi:sigma-B regulation protein RsbU (phosphoserine phosphatase)